MSEDFGQVLDRYMREMRRGPGVLAKLSGVPRQTIISWQKGYVDQPRNWIDVAKVAKAFPLTEGKASKLLTAAGYGPIANLRKQENKEEEVEVLSYWKEQEPVSKSEFTFQARAETEHFIGRQQHLEEIERILFEGHRICVIHGMAGVGKTALALKVAYHLRDEFPEKIPGTINRRGKAK